jgi:hypothetical protein
MPEGPEMVFLKELAGQFTNQPVLKAEGSGKSGRSCYLLRQVPAVVPARCALH